MLLLKLINTLIRNATIYNIINAKKNVNVEIIYKSKISNNLKTLIEIVYMNKDV